MASIKPFRGLRYTKKAGDIDKLCCPPYDIINAAQRENYLKENPYNIIRLELPKPVEDKSDNTAPYKEAGSVLDTWLYEGILEQDDSENYYIYEMEFDILGFTYAVKGLICLVKLHEFSEGVVLPHEETLSKAKTDRLNLIKATGCNFSQIYSLYMDEDESLFSLLDDDSWYTPLSSFTDDGGVKHNLWKITDKDVIAEITEKVEEKKLYIADGHHRYETALNYKKYTEQEGKAKGNSDYVMMMLVNMENEGLVVLPTHRIVRGLEDYDYDTLIKGCREYFDIHESLNAKAVEKMLSNAYENNEKAFALYRGDELYSGLILKDTKIMEELMPNCSQSLRELDVSILHTLVLERILGIDKENMAAQINLSYTRNTSEAIKAVDSREANCAFILNPTRVPEIRDVALNGEKMPQKSTYFYPKLTTGLVMNKI